MHRYTLFGGCLHSALEFPELPASPSLDETWRLSLGTRGDLELAGPMLGSEDVHAGCTVRSFQLRDGLRLVYDDTGVFDVRHGGREMTWYPADASVEADARLDATGRVLAVALHLQGVLALHGSAVAVEGQAVAFVAPKTYGKSTLALALANSGACFLSDDTVPVEPLAAPVVRPGIDHVRVHEDTVVRLAPRGRLTTASAREKHLIAMPSTAAVPPAPLAAVYVLAPSAPGTGVPVVRRTRLPAVPGALALVRHAKVGGLLGGAEAARLLEQATAVARVAPVYLLEVARDLDRLPEAAAAILGWHGRAVA